MADYISKDAMRDVIRKAERLYRVKGLGWVEMEMDKLPIISSSNNPLTPEELLEMVGQPVWTVGVSFTDDGKWAMWDIVEGIDKDGITFGYSTESREWWNYNLRDEQGNLLGCAWTCYRQPPKEVQERAETD